MEEAIAATNTGPSDKALSISLADRHWLTNLPRKIFSACMKFGGSRRRDAETHGGQTDRHTTCDLTCDAHRHQEKPSALAVHSNSPGEMR